MRLKPTEPTYLADLVGSTPPTEEDQRLSPGMCTLLICGLSALLWLTIVAATARVM
jgi:hypothetical protein